LVKVDLGALDPLAADPEIHSILVGLAIGVSSFHFFYPTYYSRKQNLGRGINEAVRILETNDSRRARQILIGKYNNKLQPNEEELKKSAKKVQNDLLMIQNWLEEKGIPKKTILDLYSEIFVNTVDSYVKYLEEFHPGHKVDFQIRKLFKNAYRRFIHDSSKKPGKHALKLGEDLWDKIGL
jgi:hypothetical protein